MGTKESSPRTSGLLSLVSLPESPSSWHGSRISSPCRPCAREGLPDFNLFGRLTLPIPLLHEPIRDDIDGRPALCCTTVGQRVRPRLSGSR